MDQTLSTKDKIVALGKDLIQQVGYHSFNYRQIATHLNIKNAAVHHYYPSKEDLGIAVIEKDKQDFIVMSQKTAGLPAKEKLEILLKTYQHFEEERKLCLIGTFASCYTDIPEKMQSAAKSYLDLINFWLQNTIQEGINHGELKLNEETSVEETVNTWITALPGALQIGRMRGKVYFDQMINSLRNSVHAA